MKKIFFLFLIVSFCLSGCSQNLVAQTQTPNLDTPTIISQTWTPNIDAPPISTNDQIRAADIKDMLYSIVNGEGYDSINSVLKNYIENISILVNGNSVIFILSRPPENPDHFSNLGIELAFAAVVFSKYYFVTNPIPERSLIVII